MGTHYLLFKNMFAVGRGQIVIFIAQGSHLPRSSISLLPSERKEEETDSLAFTMVLSPSGTDFLHGQASNNFTVPTKTVLRAEPSSRPQ